MARLRAAASSGLGLALVVAACVLWASDEGPERADALLSAVPFFVTSSNGAQLQTSYGGAQQLPGGGSVSFATPQQAAPLQPAQLQALDYQDGIQQGLRSAVNAQGLAYAPTIEQGFVPQNLGSAQPTIEQGFVPQSVSPSQPTIEQGFVPDAPEPESMANAPLSQQGYYPAQAALQQPVVPVQQPQFQRQPLQQMRFLPQYAPSQQYTAPQYAAAQQEMTKLPPAQPQSQPEIYVSAGDLRAAPRGALFPQQSMQAAEPEQAAQLPAQPATPSQLPMNQQLPARQPAEVVAPQQMAPQQMVPQQMAPQQEQPLAYLPPAAAPAASVPSYLKVESMPALHGLEPLPPTTGAAVQGMQGVQTQGEEWQEPIPLSVAAERAGAADKAEASARAEAAREQAARQARAEAAQQALEVQQEQALQRQEELRSQQAAQAAQPAPPPREVAQQPAQPAQADTGRVATLEGEVAALQRGKARALAALRQAQQQGSAAGTGAGRSAAGTGEAQHQGQALVQARKEEAPQGEVVRKVEEGHKVKAQDAEAQKAGAAEEEVAAAGEKAAAVGEQRVHQDLRLAEETDRNAVGILAQVRAELERQLN